MPTNNSAKWQKAIDLWGLTAWVAVAGIIFYVLLWVVLIAFVQFSG